MNQKVNQKFGFYISVVLIVLTIILSVAVFNKWINLRLTFGGFFFNHLLSWIGSIYFAVYTPIYYWLKKRNPKKIKYLIKLHVYGNLISFLMDSIHIAQQHGRPLHRIND
jgi:hypothetical protein